MIITSRKRYNLSRSENAGGWFSGISLHNIPYALVKFRTVYWLACTIFFKFPSSITAVKHHPSLCDPRNSNCPTDRGWIIGCRR
jgi:hypothetical protein